MTADKTVYVVANVRPSPVDKSGVLACSESFRGE